MNDNYVYELEQALTHLLDEFEPGIGLSQYIIYDFEDEPRLVSETLADAVAHANEVLYGDTLDQDD